MHSHERTPRHGPFSRAARYLIPVLVLMGAAGAVAPTARDVAAAPPFSIPGPMRGVAGSQTPTAHNFIYHCNAGINTDGAGKVGSTEIVTSSAIAGQGCGQAVLILNGAPNGQFSARFGVSSADTSGQPAKIKVCAEGINGNILRCNGFTTPSGAVQPLSLDLSNALALVISFQGQPRTYIFGFQLSGGAHMFSPVQGGSARWPGAAPFSLAGAARQCNLGDVTASSPITVTQVAIAPAGSFSGMSCGQETVTLAPNVQGTLVMRYGTDDNTATVGRETLSVTVLDATGRLLRKATGVSYLGGGLKPLWVDLTGGHSVVFSLDGSSNGQTVVTALGIVPAGSTPQYAISNLVIHASSGPIAINPDVFVRTCNAGIGTDDATVDQRPVFAYTYLQGQGCGGASMLMCCTRAAGTFRALFGVPDSDTAGAQAAVSILVQDKDNHLLRQARVHASYGHPPVPVSINLDHASVVSFLFDQAQGDLYNMTLQGSATVSEQNFPPLAPPASLGSPTDAGNLIGVSPSRGTVVDPHSFSLNCNANVTTDEQPLVGATALKTWAIQGAGCGAATLNLSNLRVRHRTFYARVGLMLSDRPDAHSTVQLNVLNTAGKVIRTRSLITRYGYGTQPFSISLAGGSILQIAWLGAAVVYAMTLS